MGHSKARPSEELKKCEITKRTLEIWVRKKGEYSKKSLVWSSWIIWKVWCPEVDTRRVDWRRFKAPLDMKRIFHPWIIDMKMAGFRCPPLCRG
jgi:hypothetical protein